MINTIFTRFITYSIAAQMCLFASTTAFADSTFVGNPVPGGVAIVDLGSSENPLPLTRYGAKRVLVIEQDGHWKGLVGLSLKTLPGNYIVSYQTENGKGSSKDANIKVAPKTYPEQRIKMKQTKYVSPGKEQLSRIKEEKKHMGKLFKIWREADVSVQLSWPVVGPLSSPFGLRRFFNDQPRNPHSGIDIAAPEGTDI
ncbi:MAG: M23 family peptidase, partial [Gammaproteobacteria bacterium]|nr:M23 family peptidase [Gammaproteobacteria bacterium]